VTEEIRLDGLGIAPGVLETIVVQAAHKVDSVHSVDTGQGFAGLVGRGTGKGVEISLEDDGSLHVVMHVSLGYGDPLHEQATNIQSVVAEALESMTGQRVASVDVFVDDVCFED